MKLKQLIEYSLKETDKIIKGYNLNQRYLNETRYQDNDEEELDFSNLKNLKIDGNKNIYKKIGNKVFSKIKGIPSFVIKTAKRIFTKILKYTIFVVIGGHLALTSLQVAKLQSQNEKFNELSAELENAIKTNDIEEIVSLTGEAETILNELPEELRKTALSIIKDIKARRRVTKVVVGFVENTVEAELLPTAAVARLVHLCILIFTNQDGEVIIYDVLRKAKEHIKNNGKELNDKIKLQESVRKYVNLKLKTTLLQS